MASRSLNEAKMTKRLDAAETCCGTKPPLAQMRAGLPVRPRWFKRIDEGAACNGPGNIVAQDDVATLPPKECHEQDNSPRLAARADGTRGATSNDILLCRCDICAKKAARLPLTRAALRVEPSPCVAHRLAGMRVRAYSAVFNDHRAAAPRLSPSPSLGHRGTFARRHHRAPRPLRDLYRAESPSR